MIQDQIGPYRVIGTLGDGGSAMVWRAADNLGREVAVKQLHPELSRDASWRQRFKDDAMLMATLKHPNIVEVLAFHDEDVPYFAMELVSGETLKQVLARRTSLPLTEALALAIQACAAFSAVHAAGVTHRDIKPDNLMVSRDGVVKVLDFSIARNNGAKRRTGGGLAVGTLGYMSPEQLRGQPGDRRSDIYALGCTLYEMLAGVPPFDFEVELDVANAHIQLAPPALTGRVANLPVAMNAVVLRSLEKRPDDRFQTMAAFSEALTTGRIRVDTRRKTTVIDTSQHVAAPVPAGPARSSGSVIYGLGGAAVVAAAVAGFLVLSRTTPPTKPRDQDLASVKPQVTAPMPAAPSPIAPALQLAPEAGAAPPESVAPADVPASPVVPGTVTVAPSSPVPAPSGSVEPPPSPSISPPSPAPVTVSLPSPIIIPTPEPARIVAPLPSVPTPPDAAPSVNAAPSAAPPVETLPPPTATPAPEPLPTPPPMVSRVPEPSGPPLAQVPLALPPPVAPEPLVAVPVPEPTPSAPSAPVASLPSPPLVIPAPMRPQPPDAPVPPPVVASLPPPANPAPVSKPPISSGPLPAPRPAAPIGSRAPAPNSQIPQRSAPATARTDQRDKKAQANAMQGLY